MQIDQHLRAAQVKLKQVHDGYLHVRSGIAAARTEIEAAYKLSERIVSAVGN